MQVQKSEAGLVALFSSSSTVVCPNEATHGKPKELDGSGTCWLISTTKIENISIIQVTSGPLTTDHPSVITKPPLSAVY